MGRNTGVRWAVWPWGSGTHYTGTKNLSVFPIHSPGGRVRESLKEVSVAEHSQVVLIPKQEATFVGLGKNGQLFINPCACHQRLHSARGRLGHSPEPHHGEGLAAPIGPRHGGPWHSCAHIRQHTFPEDFIPSSHFHSRLSQPSTSDQKTEKNSAKQ